MYVCMYVCTMLFVMTSGDLNIDLTSTSFFTKLVSPSTNYQKPFAVCCYDSLFSRSDGEPNGPRPISSLSEPARNRIKADTIEMVSPTSWTGQISASDQIKKTIPTQIAMVWQSHRRQRGLFIVCSPSAMYHFCCSQATCRLVPCDAFSPSSRAALGQGMVVFYCRCASVAGKH